LGREADGDKVKTAGKSKMTAAQRAALVDAIKPGYRVLEIGTFDGATAAILADAHPDAVIMSVDIFRDVSPSGWFANRRKNMALYVGTSRGVLSWARRNSFDLIIVDADHGYPGCYRDLRIAARLLKSGGRLFAHDYDPDVRKWPGVIQSVDEFCAKKGRRIIGSCGSLVEIA
jgi:predicted O-methyltransferase YrrM